MLEIKNMETSYGQSQVLYGIDLTINQGEVVTLIGRNGMGKTTTINSIMGLIKIKSGEIIFNGKHVQKWAPYKVAVDTRKSFRIISKIERQIKKYGESAIRRRTTNAGNRTGIVDKPPFTYTG